MSDYKFKTQPFKHQLDALAQSATKKNFAYFMEMGCFGKEVEFLTNRGWISFEDFDLDTWERPLLVAQAIPDPEDPLNWKCQFVEPEAFIKKDAYDWYKFNTRNPYGHKPYYLRVTGEHTFPVAYSYTHYHGAHPTRGPKQTSATTKKFLEEDMTAKWVHQTCVDDRTRVPYITKGKDRVFNLSIPTVFKGGLIETKSKYYTPNQDLRNLTEWELRFMVACIADGTFPSAHTTRCDFYFNKDRKAERLRYIAGRAGISLAYEKKVRSNDYTVHTFHSFAPLKYKIFNSDWYSLTQKQLEIVAEEVFYWDGHVRNASASEASHDDSGSTFYTVHKESADFVQYALAMCGSLSSLAYEPGGHANGLWKVHIRHRHAMRPETLPEGADKLPEWEWYGSTMKMSEYQEYPDTAYCWRVPSGYLFVRSDNKTFITGNSGKTKVMLDNIGILQKGGHITGALILAPKGVYRNWSEKEIPTHFPDDVDKEVLVWDAAASDTRKRKLLQQIYDWDRRKFQFMVFNIESLISERGKILLQAFVRTHGGNVLALVDESTCIKNHRAKRTKEAIEIAKRCKARRIATGSPVTNSPLDLYSQCAFLDPGLLGCGSYYAFKNTYANIEKVQNRQGQHYEKILSYKNLDRLSALLDKFSFRVTKKECLDLPDKIYTTRDVDLTPEQVKLYREMANYQYTILKDGDDIKEMSAQVVLTKLLRLHQILCGTFTSDDGEVKRLPNNRLDALQEVLDETSGKVIIWATYLGDIEAIQEMLTNEYGAGSFVSYYGATSSEDRTKAIELFQDENSNVRFFVGNVQTAGRGITLTAASTVVYYSNNFSLELRQQSEDRAHRLGQKNNVTYVDLVVRGSLDEKIIKSLLEKRNIANEILKDDLEPWISLRHA